MSCLEIGVETPWPRGSEALFSYADNGMGEGEYALAATLLGLEVIDVNQVTLMTLDRFVSGQTKPFDIEINERLLKEHTLVGGEPLNVAPEHLGRYEVKKPSPYGDIRCSLDGIAAAVEGLSFFRGAADAIKRAFLLLDEALELYLPTDAYQAIRIFALEEVHMFHIGNISRGRVLGPLRSKRVTRKFGMLQIAMILQHFKHARAQGLNKTHRLTIWNGSSVADEVETDVRSLARFLGTMGKLSRLDRLGVSDFDRDILEAFDHAIFDRPACIEEAWDNLVDPRQAFANVDYLALVGPKQFKLIHRENLRDELELKQIVQGGRPCFQTTFRDLSVTSPSAEE